MTADAAVRPAGVGAPPGRTPLGEITLVDRVVEKVAAIAITEVPDAGSAAPQVLGRSMTAAAALGGRPTSLDGLPKVSADVDGAVVALDLTISVRWPASVPEVTTAVRDRVRHQVAALTGLTVLGVDISVTDLVTRPGSPSRTR